MGDGEGQWGTPSSAAGLASSLGAVPAHRHHSSAASPSPSTAAEAGPGTASPPLVLLTLAVMAAGVAFPYTALGAAAGLAPLPGSYFPWLAATLVCYCLLTQAVKRWCIHRFGTWL